MRIAVLFFAKRSWRLLFLASLNQEGLTICPPQFIIHSLPMTLEQRISSNFNEHEQVVAASLNLVPAVARAADSLTQTLLADGKILACGNGGSAADAQHLAAELVGRFERERPELRALALSTDTSILTAIGNDYGFDEVFAKQVRAWGQSGDALVVYSTSGNSKNILAAARAAKERGMKIIAFTGKGGGRLGEMLGDEDVHLCVPYSRTARIQEIHLLMSHALCDAIDVSLLGENE
jgi:D-sedoheptulose 7-phosphate isomerase